MYFNNSKENTNIDNEFKSNKKLNFDFSKYKIPIFIGGGILIFIILLIVILSLVRNNKTSYYIELFGNDVMTIYLGDTFNDPGYNAYDNKNNDLTNEVIVDNQVDTNTIGEYQVTYTLYNTIKTRYVNVTDKPVGATSLFLKGDINMYLEVGEKYTEPGYVVIDSIDGSLKDKVKINNNVDTSKAGTYKVIYSVVNSSGVTTSAIRTVIVLGSEISLNLSNESYTNKDIAINIYIADNYFDYLILPNGDKVTKNEYSYKVSENGIYTFTSYNKLGKKKEESIKVSNINKTSPTGSCSGSYKNGSSSVKINASDDIGISKYVVNGVTSTSSNVTLSSEVKTASVTIYDKAGNTKIISCNLTNNNGSDSSKPSSSSGNQKSSKLEMHFIGSKAYDDAILIRTDNKTIMIDGGSWGCRNYVTPYLQELGVKKIDAMIGSHLHYNHIQTQGDLLEKFEVDKIYYPDDIYNCNRSGSCDNNDQAYILSAIKNYNKEVVILKPGEKITVGEMEIYILAPKTIITGGSYPQNANSFIFILKYYNNTFMFTGDAGASQLIGTKLKPYADSLGISLDVDLLKYPHHGNASLYDNFLSYAKPEYTIVPNNNKPAYPNSTNKAMLDKYNVKMYRQSDSSTGNILVTSDGNKIEITMNVKAEQYKR